MNKITTILFLVFLIFGIVLITGCRKDPVPPTLTTAAVTDITIHAATSGGSVTKDGGAAVTARGICWSTAELPSVRDSHTADNKGTGSFTSDITNLSPSTIYHVRAYATNKVGTSYGNDISFTTSQIVVATLSTTTVTGITLTTAITGGNITADGGGAVTARGICWATTANPVIGATNTTTDGTGTGVFTSNLAGLLPGTAYHVRAYATNSAGTAYGADVPFTTLASGAVLTTIAASAITQTTAVSGGSITSNGGSVITTSGICWSLTADPTITDSKTTNGTPTGTFTGNLTGLLAGTTYHVRAYATNGVSTSYGNDISFTTLTAVATLTTTAASAITQTTAVSGGNITSNGGSVITVSGICWSLTVNPTTTDSKTTNGTPTGTFTGNLTGLSAGTTYHVRAYATNSAGTAYGADVPFTTNPALIPTLTTTAVTGVTYTTAASGGNITADGGGAVTARGVCWATTANPVIGALNTTTNGTGTGVFTSAITGLLPGTGYHVRAYATNSAGTAYGADVPFTTNPAVVPTLTTTLVTGVTLTAAASGGNITADGGGAVTARGVCWATTANPVIGALNTTTNGTGTGVFTSAISGLTDGTNYYARAYATNSAGTAYGNQQRFTTVHQTSTVSDNDGNTYNTVKIGNQWWMAENLKTTKFNNNSAINNVTLATDWKGLTTPAYCWYNNDGPTYKPLYGALYNWFAVNTGNLCPTGWHVPSDAEFSTMEEFLGIPADTVGLWGFRGTISQAGNQMKNTTGWDVPPNNGTNGTNTSGFSGIPGGYRYGVDGSFQSPGYTYWWSSTFVDVTTSYYRRLDATNFRVFRGGVLYQGGKYVRCVQN